MKPSHYVLFSVPDKASRLHIPYVMFVSSVLRNGDLSGTLETKTVHFDAVSVSVSPKDVRADLGPDPLPGKVYGVDLSTRYRGPIDFKSWTQPVHFFTDVEDSARVELDSSFRFISSALKRVGLSGLVDDSLLWEVGPKRGKTAGYYQHSKDVEKRPHIIRISVAEDFAHREQKKTPPFAYVIAHELGHSLHFRYLTEKAFPKLNARWLQTFLTSVEAAEVDRLTRSRLISSLASSNVSLSEWLPNQSEEDAAAFKLLLKEVRVVRRLSTQDVNLLCSAGHAARLADLIPDTSVFSPRPRPILTDYATKNYRELFADTFAFWLLGAELPDYLTDLMEKSVGHAKSLM